MVAGYVYTAALVVLLIVFRSALAFLYSSFKKTRPKWAMWGALALFWGIWSLPFWLNRVIELKDLRRDIGRVWPLNRLLDRANVLSLLFVFILAQFLSTLGMMPILLLALVQMNGPEIMGNMHGMLSALSRPWALLIILFYLNGTIAAIIYLWGIEPGWLTCKDLGLTKKNLGRNILIGLAMGVALVLVSGVLEYLIGLLLPTDLPDILDPSNDTFVAQDMPSLLMILAGACVMAPLGEELYFRGYLYAGLGKGYRLPVVFIISSAYFSVGHFNLIFFPIFFLAGLMLIYVRHKSQSLVPSIIMHSVNNLAAIGYAYLFSG
jgi:membrane protease YdiL (CAAX protease family)